MTTTPTLFRGEQRANTVETDSQFGQKIVGLKDGSFVVLWVSDADVGAGDENSNDIIGRHYDAEGNALGGEFRANQSFFLDREDSFSAEALPDGNFVLVYEDTDENGTSIKYDILSPDGTRVDFGTIHSDPGVDTLANPSVAVADDGSFLVAYDRGNGDTEVVKVAANGVVGTPEIVVSHGESFVNTAVTALTNGNFVAITEDTSATNDAGIAFRLVNSAGDAIGSATSVGNTFSNGQADFRPSVTALTGGGFVVSWTNLDQDDDIQFQRYDAAGNEVGGVRTVNSAGATDNNDDTSLVALSDGGFAIAYTDDVDQTVKVQRFNAAGNEVGDTVTVENEGFSNSPDIALSADGRLLVTWGVLDDAFDDQDVEFAILDPRDSVIEGSDASETITSRQDGATVQGLGGSDLLLGQSNDDILNGGTGLDTMRGRAGDDTFIVDAAGDLVFEAAGAGADRINASVSYVLAAGQHVETLGTTSVAGTGDINLTGNEFAQTLFGNAGDNVLNGAGGADTLQGFGGNDTYVVDSAGDQVLEVPGDGLDRINASTSYAVAAGQQVEILGTTSVAGTGAINLTGNATSQTLFGNAGANFLNGAGGADTLSGFGGADTFSFTTALGGGNVDHVTDFSVATDTIRLAEPIFSALNVGALAASAFKDVGDPGAVVDANDRILYNDNTGALFYDTNGSSAGGRTQFAVLDTSPANLTFADFIVVA